VPQQQGPLFVAPLAKNRLSDFRGFGMMRLASRKEFGVQESARRKSREVS
jgi:hypothetical protein